MTPADTPQTHRCRAGAEIARCDFRGTREELRAHADEVGHARCCVCADALAWHEVQTCFRCASRVRDDLDGIAVAFAHLERVLGQAAYRGINWTALTLVSDGSVSGGGPDDHVRYHDPAPAIAILEEQDRIWREEFGHPRPAYHALGHPDRETPKQLLGNVVDYLRTWHTLAARTYPDFAEYATAVGELRASLDHAAGIAESRLVAPIPCACGGRLIRHYLPCSCAADRPHRCGLEDTWTCRACGTDYDPDRYVWRLRLLTELPGWVSVERAAASVGRTVSTVWEWVYILDVPSVCSRVTRRTVVELEAVQERAAQARVTRRSA